MFRPRRSPARDCGRRRDRWCAAASRDARAARNGADPLFWRLTAESFWWRSPKLIALVGQALWQAVLTSSVPIGRSSRSAAAARRADALDAVGAFLHHAARAHRDFRILLGAIGLEAEIGVFLTVGVSEEIEAAYLVGTVGLAEPRADAAVVNLQVQPFAVMHRGGHRTDRLARRVLAMHAGHRLKPELRVRFRAMVVDVDPQPMHVAAARNFFRPDHRDIVLGLAGDHAGVAADAHGGVDHHRPGVAVIRLGPLRQQARLFLLGCRRPLGRLGEIVQRIELADVLRRADHVLCGEDLLLAGRSSRSSHRGCSRHGRCCAGQRRLRQCRCRSRRPCGGRARG